MIARSGRMLLGARPGFFLPDWLQCIAGLDVSFQSDVVRGRQVAVEQQANPQRVGRSLQFHVLRRGAENDTVGLTYDARAGG